MCSGECRVWNATRLECKGSVSTVADAGAAQAVCSRRPRQMLSAQQRDCSRKLPHQSLHHAAALGALPPVLLLRQLQHVGV